MKMGENKTVLCLVAHPDDAELQCAGTLALLAEKGWEIVIATMTPGQAGSDQVEAEEISAIRRIEAAASAALLNGTYECLESEDIFVMYDRPTLLKAIALFRKVRPTIVFTASPSDYIIDHEVTSKIAQTACLAAGIPNIKIEDTNPTIKGPYLYYCEPTQGKDIFGNKIQSTIHVDISSTIAIKEKMLGCHASQRSWLLKISQVDEYMIMMKEYSKEKGREINCKYAEGFRQHLGFSYPSANILKAELGDLVHL
jgi:LmbE family N-acetylglucosaminyl deacetylase